MYFYTHARGKKNRTSIFGSRILLKKLLPEVDMINVSASPTERVWRPSASNGHQSGEYAWILVDHGNEDRDKKTANV